LTDFIRPSNIHTSQPQSDPSEYKVGYEQAAEACPVSQGYITRLVPTGRGPSVPPGISIKEILDGDQRGKNGEVISRREAIVIALVNDALRGNQKSFTKFMKLMKPLGPHAARRVKEPDGCARPYQDDDARRIRGLEASQFRSPQTTNR